MSLSDVYHIAAIVFCAGVLYGRVIQLEKRLDAMELQLRMIVFKMSPVHTHIDLQGGD